MTTSIPSVSSKVPTRYPVNGILCLYTPRTQRHPRSSLDLLKSHSTVPCGIAEEQLRYSIETWTCQLQDFVTEVIQQPVYLAGNSLGGLLSAHLAATQAHLCRCLSHLLCLHTFIPSCTHAASSFLFLLPEAHDWYEQLAAYHSISKCTMLWETVGMLVWCGCAEGLFS